MKNIITLMLGLATLLGVSFGSLFVPVMAQGSPAAHQAHQAKGDMETSGKACANCATTCEKTLSYFQKKGGKYAEAKNQDVLKDCIALCKASADLKSRKSAHAAKLDAVCNEVCKQCAEMCKEMKDPALKDCIQSCETCHDCCG